MMEKLTEEAGKITDTATKFTDEAGKIVLERFKNPYILTFLISWLLFNWRPLSYFILSSEKVEIKIKFINENYSDYSNYFIWPFGITMLYLFALPYLNMINEWCIKWSVKYRAGYAAEHLLDKIKNDTKIAIAENNKQIAISEAKESTDHNKFVDELQNNIKILHDNLQEERLKSLELLKITEDEKKKLLETQENLVISNREELKVLDSRYNQLERDFRKQLAANSEELERKEEEYKNTIKALRKEVSKVNFFKNRLKNQSPKLIKLSNNRRLFETFDEAEEPRYYDIDRESIITEDEFFENLTNKAFVEVEDVNNKEFRIAFEILHSILPF